MNYSTRISVRLRVLRFSLLAMLCSGVTLADTDNAAIDVILFPLGTALPLYIAHDEGMFERQGLAVTLTATPDSPTLVEGLANGTYQVAMAALDNFIAYQEDQHLARYQPGRDLFVFMGGSPMNLPLVAKPEIDRIEKLRGTSIGVDTPVTAFAFVLYRMLEDAGIARGDYNVVEAGATNRRWQALRAGEIDATVLADGLSQQAQNEGFNILANSLELLGAYQGTVLGSERTWAAQNGERLTRFSAAVLEALDWLYDPANERRAAEILAAHLGMPLPAAERAVAGLKGPGGLTRDGAILRDGVDVVLALRRQYGTPPKPLADQDAYIDLTHLEAAQRARR